MLNCDVEDDGIIINIIWVSKSIETNEPLKSENSTHTDTVHDKKLHINVNGLEEKEKKEG